MSEELDTLAASAPIRISWSNIMPNSRTMADYAPVAEAIILQPSERLFRTISSMGISDFGDPPLGPVPVMTYLISTLREECPEIPAPLPEPDWRMYYAEVLWPPVQQTAALPVP